MIKPKKSKLTKSKKSSLAKIKKLEFTKVNSSKTEFLTPKAKKTFLHLQKTFIKASILGYADTKYYIWMNTDTLEYAMDEVLSQITLKQSLSNHVTHKNSDSFKVQNWLIIPSSPFLKDNLY